MSRPPDPSARPKLLAACRAAFAESGVDGARVEDVARAAGLSKGAFYLHFESKEAAFAEVVGGFFAELQGLADARRAALTALRARMGAPTAEDWRLRTPRAEAHAALDHDHTVRTLKAMWWSRDVLRMVLEHGGPDRAGLLDRFIDVARENLSSQLSEAMAAGAFRDDVDRDLVSELLIGLYLQLGRRMVRSPTQPDFDVWARAVDTLIVEGLARRAPLPDPPVREGA